MKLIISPAKKMRADPDSLPWRDLPAFLPQTERLLHTMQGMSGPELKKLWKCNDSIARLNLERLEHMDLKRNLTPAILAYDGIQYQHMAPGVFTLAEFDYIQEHLRILSGFYGVLRPFDGVTPYRLEMQAKLAVGDTADLYQFWGDQLAREVLQETDLVLDLASREYSRCVSNFLPEAVQMVRCVFGQNIEGKIVEKGTLCKMARGEMVRHLAQCQGDGLEAVRAFDRLDFRFSPGHSDARTCVFIQREKGR